MRTLIGLLGTVEGRIAVTIAATAACYYGETLWNRLTRH